MAGPSGHLELCRPSLLPGAERPMVSEGSGSTRPLSLAVTCILAVRWT